MTLYCTQHMASEDGELVLVTRLYSGSTPMHKEREKWGTGFGR